MQKIRIDNWTWFIENRELLEGWFEQWEDFSRDSVVKQNPVRTVCRIDDLFYLKIEKPVDLPRRFRNLLLPKAAKEFATGRALEAAGVPAVKHLGWAKRGSSNMLLTEAVPDSCSVHEYWYNEIVYGNASKKIFLDGFAGFLKLFFNSGFYHPDFHIGNILYSPRNGEFTLVDVYGISRPGRLSEQQISRQSRIFLELHRALSDSEAIAFLMKVRNELSLEEARSFWENGLRERAERIRQDWAKRRCQIQNNYSKFIEVFKVSGKEFSVRKIFGSKPTVNLDECPDCLTGDNFDIKRLSPDEAENTWMESFRLELLGIDHQRPLVFEKPGTLYFEKISGAADKIPREKAEEFIARAGIAGRKIAGEALMQLANGRIISTKI